MSEDGNLDKVEQPGDPRWQLVERISATAPFRKSARFRDLLRYLAEQAIKGNHDHLTETKIGHAVFLKPDDYSPTEDSTVRVHVRQLRLKLHEYFDTVGRDEKITIEIPKGGFLPVFQAINEPVREDLPEMNQGSQESLPTTSIRRESWLVPALLGSIFVLATLCLILVVKMRSIKQVEDAPWPLSALINSASPTTIVIADVNNAMMDLLHKHNRSLQEYLGQEHVDDFSEKVSDPGERALIEYIESSTLTSSADATIAAKLANAFGRFYAPVSVRSARDLRPRDFDNGSFIVLGSITSNLWASMYQSQLNFEEVIDPSNHQSVAWKNKSPKPGEQALYNCPGSTGGTGTDFADIALLPSHNNRDSILLLQGCLQEGTESTVRFLVSDNGRKELMKALGISKSPLSPTYFEALIKTQVIAGTPNTSSIVAIRLFRP